MAMTGLDSDGKDIQSFRHNPALDDNLANWWWWADKRTVRDALAFAIPFVPDKDKHKTELRVFWTCERLECGQNVFSWTHFHVETRRESLTVATRYSDFPTGPHAYACEGSSPTGCIRILATPSFPRNFAYSWIGIFFFWTRIGISCS